MTTDTTLGIHGGIGDEAPVPMKDEPKKAPSEKQEKTKEEPAKACFAEQIAIGSAECGGTRYGATARYCYFSDKQLWFKESVKDAPSPDHPCSTDSLDQSTQPGVSSTKDNCFRDEIINQNGPPSKVAPCTDRTLQTAFVGPTRDSVEQCKYSHEQLIKVTVTKRESTNKPTAGKVITSVITLSGELKTECDWTA